jgi:multicomponent Na+:H+ antiporter subunit G
MIEWIVGILLLLGGFLAFVAALGVLRLPDVLIRMHASTKAGTLACGVVAVAAALHFADSGVTVRAVAIVLFLILTAPVAAHMIGRAAVRIGVPMWKPADARESREPRE